MSTVFPDHRGINVIRNAGGLQYSLRKKKSVSTFLVTGNFFCKKELVRKKERRKLHSSRICK
jgi:hypothetical protein